jgi:hypothetical protein
MEITLESLDNYIPFYLTQPAKESLVSAFNSFPEHFDYYIDKYPTDILQGDGWNNLGIIQFESGDRKLIKGIVLSNSCDISQENKRDRPISLVFAPLFRLEAYSQMLCAAGIQVAQLTDKLRDIRNQKVTSLFYLPKGGGLDAEYLAFLDDIHTMPLNLFCANAQRGKLFTLSTVGFYLFLFKLSVHFCRFHEELEREA